MEIVEPNLEQAPGWERVVYAKDQPAYRPLPVLRSMDAEVRVVSRWQPTPEEREQIAKGADVFVTVLTFGGPLQPQLVTIGGAPIYPIPLTPVVVSDDLLRDTKVDAAAMVNSALDRLPVTDDPAAVDRTIMPDGQQRQYLVLSAEERAKGFVRPLRRSYRHVGIPGPRYALRDLTEEERARHASIGYVKFEDYPQHEAPVNGRYWTEAQLAAVGKGCGTVTTMGLALCETYARDPHFYSGTFCAGCGTHHPVGRDGEFVWVEDGQRVGA